MLEQTRGEDCLSDLRLDQLRVHDLDREEAASARSHLQSCPRCAARATMLQRDADRFDLRLGRHGLGPKRRRGSQALAWGMALAAIAVLVVVGREPGRPGASETEDPSASVDVVQPTTRTKGRGQSLGYYVHRRGRAFRADENTVVHPGDRLRFTVSSPQDTYVAVISVDGAGVVTVYHPRGTTTALVRAGYDQLLDGAVELDDTMGTEHIHAFFCAEPVDVATLRDAIVLAPHDPRAPSGCTTVSLQVWKQAPP